MLQEIACLISEPGSRTQPLHPDTPYTSSPPLYAAFVALQDIDIEMGPTVYLPGTQTREVRLTPFRGSSICPRLCFVLDIHGVLPRLIQSSTAVTSRWDGTGAACERRPSRRISSVPGRW